MKVAGQIILSLCIVLFAVSCDGTSWSGRVNTCTISGSYTTGGMSMIGNGDIKLAAVYVEGSEYSILLNEIKTVDRMNIVSTIVDLDSFSGDYRLTVNFDRFRETEGTIYLIAWLDTNDDDLIDGNLDNYHTDGEEEFGFAFADETTNYFAVDDVVRFNYSVWVGWMYVDRESNSETTIENASITGLDISIQ